MQIRGNCRTCNRFKQDGLSMTIMCTKGTGGLKVCLALGPRWGMNGNEALFESNECDCEAIVEIEASYVDRGVQEIPPRELEILPLGGLGITMREQDDCKLQDNDDQLRHSRCPGDTIEHWKSKHTVPFLRHGTMIVSSFKSFGQPMREAPWDPSLKRQRSGV